MTLTYFEPPAVPANEVLRELAVAASGALDLMGDPVLATIAEDTRRALRTEMSAVTVIHNDWQYIIAGAGIPAGVDSRRTSFCGHTIADDATIFVVPDARRDRRFAGNPVVEEGPCVRFYAAVVLAEPRQPAIGALCVFDPRPRAGITLEEVEALQGGAVRVLARIRKGREARGVPEITARQRATLDLTALSLS